VKSWLTTLALALCVSMVSPRAQEIAPAASAEDVERMHTELRALRDGLIKATNDGNIDGVLEFLHPNVVITWQNAEVSRGRDGVRAYLARMTSGPAKVVGRFQTEPTVDELTILYGGDAGIAFGTSKDRFELTDGMNFDLTGRWSATMVREGGRWLIASFHASSNLFDNPVLNLATRSTMWTGVGGLVVGALIALIVSALVWRRRRPAAA
jgi:ketosteroid isomerase-like protein